MACANLFIPNDFNIYANVYKGSENEGLYYEAHHTNTIGGLTAPADSYMGSVLESGTTLKLDYTNKTFGGSAQFYCKFIGWITTPQQVNEDFTFYLTGDNFANLYIDGQNIVNTIYTQGEQTGVYNIHANHWHPIYIVWGQGGGSSRLLLQWSSATVLKEQIPHICLKSNQLCVPVQGSYLYCGVSKTTDTTNATSSTTGSIVTLGGMGINRDLYVGGNIYSNGNKITPKVDTFSLTLNGIWATDQISQCYVIQIDNITMISIKGINEQGTINANITSTNAVPLEYRPTTTQSFSLTTFDASGGISDNSLGYGFLSPSGELTICKKPSSDTWNTGAHCGFYDFVVNFST